MKEETGMHLEKLDNEKKCQYISKNISSTDISNEIKKDGLVLIKPSKLKKEQSHIIGLNLETFIIF